MPLSAEERLIRIRVKIKRAKKHLTELEALAETYGDTYAQVVRAKDHTKFSQGPPKFVKLPVVSFEMLAIAGDVLHNLRSALDHTVYQLALVRNPKTSLKRLRETCFPIGKDVHTYKSIAGGKVKGVIEPRAMHFIDGLKPYKGGNDSLWLLTELNNIDKHRRLIAVGRNVLCEGEGFFGGYWLKDNQAPFTRAGLPKRGKNTQFTGIKSLLQFQAVKRKTLIPTLVELTDFVESLVEDFNVFLAKS